MSECPCDTIPRNLLFWPWHMMGRPPVQDCTENLQIQQFKQSRSHNRLHNRSLSRALWGAQPTGAPAVLRPASCNVLMRLLLTRAAFLLGNPPQGSFLYVQLCRQSQRSSMHAYMHAYTSAKNDACPPAGGPHHSIQALQVSIQLCLQLLPPLPNLLYNLIGLCTQSCLSIRASLSAVHEMHSSQPQPVRCMHQASGQERFQL